MVFLDGIGGIGWGKTIEVKGKGSGMAASQVEGILKVHEEGGAMPAETILNEGIREVGAMKQVSSSDLNGMGRLSLEGGLLGG